MVADAVPVVTATVAAEADRSSARPQPGVPLRRVVALHGFPFVVGVMLSGLHPAGDEPAVDGDRCAVDVDACSVHSQTPRPGDVCRNPVRPQRDLLEDPRQRRRVVPQVRAVQLGLDPSRVDDVRPDPDAPSSQAMPRASICRPGLGGGVVDLAGVRLRAAGDPITTIAPAGLWPSPRRRAGRNGTAPTC